MSVARLFQLTSPVWLELRVKKWDASITGSVIRYHIGLYLKKKRHSFSTKRQSFPSNISLRLVFLYFFCFFSVCIAIPPLPVSILFLFVLAAIRNVFRRSLLTREKYSFATGGTGNDPVSRQGAGDRDRALPSDVPRFSNAPFPGDVRGSPALMLFDRAAFFVFDGFPSLPPRGVRFRRGISVSVF